MVQSVVLDVVRLGWLMKYYNYEFNYGFLSVGLFIFTCYCGGQAWLSAGTWFNDTYVMNCFYQLFFCLSLMSNNVPATTDLLRFWLPAVWTDQVYSSLLDLSLKSIWGDSWCRRDWWFSSETSVGGGNAYQPRSTQYFSPLSLFCLLT